MKLIPLTGRSRRAMTAAFLTLIILPLPASVGAAGRGAEAHTAPHFTTRLKHSGGGAAGLNVRRLPGRSLSPAPVAAAALTGSADLYAYAAPSLNYVPSGGSFSYLVYVGNGSPDVADDAYVTGTFPASITVGNVANSYGSCGTTTGSGGVTTLNCDLGDIGGYGSRTITVTASPAGTAYSVISATFGSGSATPDPNSGNDSNAVIIRIASPALPTPTPATGANPLIAFVEGGAEIHAVGADGTGEVNLTDSPVDEEFYEWSPDGTRLVFVRYDDMTGEDNIFVMDADGTDQTQLTGVAGDHFYDPTWSPDGTRIAFSRYVSADGQNVIGVMDADGTDQVMLTSGASAYDHGPRWSPDASKIAFSRYDMSTGAANIYVMDADGTDLLDLTNHASYNFAPEWSPGGTRIAFTSYRDGNAEIYLMNPDGTQLSNLTQSADSDNSPRWSPDGTKLAFYRSHSGGSGVYVVGADGTGLSHLGDDVEHNSEPDWSPDGTRLAFTTARNGVGAINLVNADGSGRTQLITSQYACTNPRWQRTN